MRTGFSLVAVVILLAGCSQGSDTAQAPQQQAPEQQAAQQQEAPEQPQAPAAAPPSQAASPGTATAPLPSADAGGPPTGTALAPTDRAAGTPAAERGPAAAAQEPEPQLRAVTIPAGTTLRVRLSTPVASDTSALEDEVRGTLARAIVIDGVTVAPAGTEVVGTVRSAKRSGRVKGRASISFRFERLLLRDESHAIRTALISRQAEVKRREDVKKGAIGAGAGAIVGGIIGGGKGAAIGAGVGGAGAVMATRGEEVRLPEGTTVRTTLEEPIEVVVPR